MPYYSADMLRSLHLLIVFVILHRAAFSQSPDFSILIEPGEITVSPGDVATYTIHVSSINGFASPVLLELLPMPGVSYQFSFSMNPVTPAAGSVASAQFTLRFLNDADAAYTFTVRGTNGQSSHTATATLRAQRPKDSFILSASAESVVLQSGLEPGSAQIVVTAEPVGQYVSPVELTLTETGPYIVTFEKRVLAPWESTRVTITKTDRGPLQTGGYGIQIRGTGTGGASFNLDIGVHVIPDFPYTTGDQKVLLARLRVKDATASPVDLQSHINRAVEYYREVSYGQLRLQFDVLGESLELSGTDQDYRLGRRTTPQDALEAIDPHVDLRNYKFYVFLLDGWTPPAFAAPFENKDSNDGVINMAAAYLPSSAPALMVHEMGHMFYLPDLYDVKREQFFFTYWDEMGEGAAHFSGWSRLKLGWLPEENVTEVVAGETKTLTLSPIALPGAGTKLIRIPKVALPEVIRPNRPPFRPSFSNQRFFFLEARKRIGFDSSLPSDGVLLYSVDESIPSGAGPLRLVDKTPSTNNLADAAFVPQPGDTSIFEDAANGLKISMHHRSEDEYDVSIEYMPPGTATSSVQLTGSGAAATSTSGGEGNTRAGYALGRLTSGVAPHALAVLSFKQNGVVVSEVGVPVSPPTTSARIFADYRRAVAVAGSSGTVEINTGFAAVNRGINAATVRITLRGVDGNTITSGIGTLAKDAHIARFLDQMGETFTGFSIPPSFNESIHFGTVELSSDQPLSVVALRLTTNQRGEMLMTTTPVADMTRLSSAASIYFPQFADGGGYTTSVSLVNTSTTSQSGVLKLYDDDGAAIELRMVDGSQGATFPYSIPAGGARVFQTDGSPVVPKVGWIELIPDSGQSTPAGAGLFQYSQNGVLVTQSGIPAATPATRARIYVDMANGHDTGLALVNPGSTSNNLALSALGLEGLPLRGPSPRDLPLSGRAHSAKFARELLPDLPSGFRGVVNITSESPFVALTVRSLVNARGDFLLTTFPVADLTAPAPVPILFPQIADGGGYKTEFIMLGPGAPGTLSLDFFSDDGTPLAVGN